MVVYKQKHNLELLYNSLAQESYTNIKIYFVDNNTGEEDRNFSEKLNSSLGLNIIYLKPGYNSGFAGGNNAGAIQAIKDGCSYIFFLNNDVVLDKDCISRLAEYIEMDSSIGVAAPLILYGKEAHENTKIQEFGAKANFKLYKIEKYCEGNKFEEARDSLPETITVDLVSGGACFVKSEILRKTGLWEDNYFAYGDEIDFAKRVMEAGYKTIVVSSSVLYHNHKWVKENKESYYFEYYLSERNKFLYYYKYKLYFSIIYIAIVDLVKFPVRLMWFMKVCDFKLGLYYLKGMTDGLLKKHGKPTFIN